MSLSGRAVRTVACLLALLLMGLAGAPADAHRHRKKKRRPPPVYSEVDRTIAPGVVHTFIKDPKGPWRIHILAINLAAQSTLDVALAQNGLPGLETTSSMARRRGAIAAINGDYAAAGGRPVFTFAEDGHLAQTPLLWGRNFSTNATETAAFIGHPSVSVWAREADHAEPYKVARMNEGVPEFKQMALYTDYGGWLERPSDRACNARVIPSESPVLLTDRPGVEVSNVVDKTACQTRMYPRGGSVVSAPIFGKYAADVESLSAGEIVTLGWSLGWPAVLDTIGGNPTLMENGKIVWSNVKGDSSFFARHPRSGVGITGDGKVLFITVDGRQKRRSVGMSLVEYAKFFYARGAQSALNLDGGGSTTMVIGGDVVNRPSSGYERSVSSALLLLPGADPHEQYSQGTSSYQEGPVPPLDPTPAPEPTPLIGMAASFVEIANDPASTGGLLDAIRRAGGWLPRSLLPVLRMFRAGR
ncbi:MAG TPA: phosphodiester glycosidase family protein [Actinomycetota bacterium]|nr:phosphodiester glycosidase family protein [Actinomycetota bacterium]